MGRKRYTKVDPEISVRGIGRWNVGAKDPVWRAIAALANARGCSIPEVTALALEEYVERHRDEALQHLRDVLGM